jgi:4-amino-4-deoxy-L-arabinose transferase-like glycosyltransferase
MPSGFGFQCRLRCRSVAVLFDASTRALATGPAAATTAPSAGWRLREVAGSGLLVAAAFLGLALILRAPAFLVSVVDPDEGLYAVQAQQWLRGAWPYVAVWDMHPVGAPGLVALALAVVGEPVLALRLLGVAAVAATGMLLRTLVIASGAGGALVGFAAGALYVAHSLLLGGLATNTEILFAPFCTAGVLLALLEGQRLLRQGLPPRSMVVGGMGLLFGVALWMKQVVAPEASAAFLALVGLAWWHGALPLRRVLALALLFAAACGLPILATAAAYAVRGEMGAFLDGMVYGPLRYGGAFLNTPDPLRSTAVAVLALCWLLLAALPAVLEAFRLRRLSTGAQMLLVAMLLWFAVRTLQVALPMKFFNHYFLLWLPPLCVLAALGLARVVRILVRRSFRRLAFRGLVAIMVVMPALQVLEPRVAHGLGWRLADPPRQIAQAILADLPSGESIHVVNYHAIIYAMVGVRPLTRYAFPDHLSGYLSTLTGVDTVAEMARVLAERPRFIVVATGRRWAFLRPESAEVVQATLASSYNLALTVQDGEGPVQLWRRRMGP